METLKSGIRKKVVKFETLSWEKSYWMCAQVATRIARYSINACAILLPASTERKLRSAKNEVT